MDYQFRPLERWPGQRTICRQSSRFGVSWSRTLSLLERELRMLKAKSIVIQADCNETEIRQDGMLRANARLRSPAVILSFDSKHGPLSYPCDRFTAWQDNIRAIALSLEALRSVDRYGVTRRAEQYKGWAKLPPPSHGGAFEDVLSARHYIESIVGRVDWREPYQTNAIRNAKTKTHPDAGGSAEAFKMVCEAEAMLQQ